jgi:hypothetical protein
MLSIILVALVNYTCAFADLHNGLPPFVNVTDYGNIHRQQFPVTGGIPLPRGVLNEGDLSRLILLSPDSQRIPVQFAAIGKWPDASIKWLLMDFQSTQDAGSTAQYKLKMAETMVDDLPLLAHEEADKVEVDTGKLKAVFDGKAATISIREGDSWQEVVDGDLISRIALRQRESDKAVQYVMPLASAAIETNGPMKAVIKFEGWHTASDGDKFLPSVVRFTFYRKQSFFRVHHTFVNSKDPDKYLLSDIAIEVPLTVAMDEGLYSVEQKSKSLGIENDRFAILQEDIAKPTYPPSREFEGRFRVFNGDDVVAEGRCYSDAMVLRSQEFHIGAFLKDMWQMSPKSLAYDPENQRLQVVIWPGNDVGDLDLMRTEVKRPDHYQEFAKNDPLYHDEEYGPAYVAHDLDHSAMGLSRTHEMILWFDAPTAELDPAKMSDLFTMPFVPFVSGEWNVNTGAMGKQILPGQYRSDIESINGKMIDELRRVTEAEGWYGMIEYGNPRYSFDKNTMNWMHYHPKYAWFNSGHMMLGGTMLQALWYQYLRTGNPLYYMTAEARGLNKMDVSTVHYHDNEKLVGNMIRHGGFDPWAGNRASHGAHAPLCGIPIQYYITGSERTRDVIDLIGQRNYQTRHFEHGRNIDTDINTMMLYYEFTLDRKYYDRAIEFIDYYYSTLEEAKEELTFFEYRTTALRTFYEMCEDPDVRHKIAEIFLASYETYREQRNNLGNLEAPAFEYEISRSREADQRLEKVIEDWARRISGELGWLDNMVMQNMNFFGKMNAVCYSLYWLHEINKDRIEPVIIQPYGGTFHNPVEVNLACETQGATIRYTLDGSEPNAMSPEYQKPIAVWQNGTIKAKAFKEWLESGSATEGIFTIGEPDLPRDQLELWLMADKGVRRLDSLAIEWLDQSGNGRHAMVDAENAPGFVANGISGLPVLRGDRRKYMRLRRLVLLRGDCTFVFVSSFLPGGFSLLGDGDDGFIAIDDFGEGGKFKVRFSAGEKGTSAWLNESYDPGSFSVWTVIRKGTRVIIYRDGKIATQNPEYHSDGTTMNLGLLMGMRPFVNNFKGELAEILIFNESLSAEERHLVEGYLMEKYDL